MKPKLRASKGWKYRVIVCDEKGRYALDDVAYGGYVPALAARLVEELDAG